VRTVLKVVGIVIGVLVCVVVVTCAILNTPPSVDESEAEEAATWTGELDWSQVEITHVEEGPDYYIVDFCYRPTCSSVLFRTLFVPKDAFSPEAINATIAEQITAYLAEEAEKRERLQELEEGLS